VIVDIHAHTIVPELLREVAPAEAWRPRIFREGGRQVIEYGGRRLTSAVREIVRPEGILAAQDAAGVDCVVLSPWAPLLRYDVPSAEGLRISRIYNEALARLAEAHPVRVRALGTVPLQDPDLAARELETVMRLPGLCGVEVAASINGASPGDDRFRPFWAAAEATGAVVFIHPTTRGLDLPALAEYYLGNAVGNPLETTIAAAHLVMAGVLEAHPRLRIVLAHGGGALPALRGRLRHAQRVTAPARARLREPVETSLARFYYDTITHEATLLRALVEFAGPEHVVLGSDYPFDMGLERPADAVRALGLPPDDEAKILGGNAVRLLTPGT
jgi:aminocarboxymuconate-semialdehyde decarboxylase